MFHADESEFTSSHRPGPNAEEYYEYDDMNLAYLDTYYGDDEWAIRYESTGSFDYDPDSY